MEYVIGEIESKPQPEPEPIISSQPENEVDWGGTWNSCDRLWRAVHQERMDEASITIWLPEDTPRLNLESAIQLPLLDPKEKGLNM